MRKMLASFRVLRPLLFVSILAGCASTGRGDRSDIVTAVQAAAAKDCGCGHCAARGCDPCHGKNCFYCVAKALVKDDCGCGECRPEGCASCGPGCDVCRFHLAPAGRSGATKEK